jgi:hypothetical protein
VKKPLGLYIFIDALGWEILQRHPEFLASLAPHRRPLETILGYSSACDPSIISGLTPAGHRLWSSYYYVPGGKSPLAWTQVFRLIPGTLSERARVRHYLSRIVQKVSRIKGYFQLYNVPFARLPWFYYAEWKRIWEPGGLPQGQSIFDLMQDAGRRWYVHDSGKNDDGKLADLHRALETGEIDLAYISLGRLDALMHAKGTKTPAITELLQWYHERIEELHTLASRHFDPVELFVFTDHGMHDIHTGVDLIQEVRGTGLVEGEDYVAFYDSTMGRFWTLSERGRDGLHQLLQDHPSGRILSPAELQELGVFFPDAQYGDLIFLLHPGRQIAPSYMGRKAIAGMHGFHPAEPESKAMICSKHPLPDGLQRIEQIFALMCHSTGITPPEGTAALEVGS